MRKVWDDEAWDDYLKWQEEDRKTLRKINKLILSIERDGVLGGIGKPEPLKYSYTGWFSRRIDFFSSRRSGGCFIVSDTVTPFPI